MLDLDMQVLAAFGAEELAAAFVGTDEGAVDFLRRSSQMLLPLILTMVMVMMIVVVGRLLLTLHWLDLGRRSLHWSRRYLGILLLHHGLPLLLLNDLGASLPFTGLLQ